MRNRKPGLSPTSVRFTGPCWIKENSADDTGSLQDATNTHVTLRKASRGKFLVLGGPTLVALWFIQSYALRYFASDPGALGIYEPRREWLFAHIGGGAAALLLGPVQLWLGRNRRSPLLHRILGIGYVLSVAVGSTAAFYLAFHTDFGWVAGLGFVGMSLAWIVTTVMAVAAISRLLIQQHHEWMIRSYVVTSSFVTFRVLTGVFSVANLGNTVEQMSAASWMSWAIPLLLCEVLLQGRKVFAPSPAPPLSLAVPAPTPVEDKAPEYPVEMPELEPAELVAHSSSKFSDNS